MTDTKVENEYISCDAAMSAIFDALRAHRDNNLKDFGSIAVGNLGPDLSRLFLNIERGIRGRARIV